MEGSAFLHALPVKENIQEMIPSVHTFLCYMDRLLMHLLVDIMIFQYLVPISFAKQNK